ncbi:MAG: DUF1642 domain-containing protein [Lacticaseibacillus paracasei]|jgi:hypothetical protein|nr:DUF1642 domain-containing protein [Lacticaseibacillus paracasei]MCH4042796.1 DUF1642 domain-containing protein [Lacticaseibacillus paracasei]MCH4117506.1 DUF1642 domain-containing protein [Lacticaseibacillus paracasei]MCI1356186.1 DUF1642 domain-containing protein [Lacticaseibacillus paracasei]MCI1377055.1 DUF1642 domain-containing protein [Lacticaseibacillus paracasei]
MSEEKLYAVKNDEGKYWDFEDRDDFWELSSVSCPTTAEEKDAKDVIHDYGGHVVTLIEEPKKLVLTKEQAEIVEKARVSDIPATYISARTDAYNDEESLLINAYVNGYTVAKEKRHLVELDGLVTTDGAKQYLTKKDGKWFACRRMPGMHQDFTDEELNKAPEWAQQLDREEVTDDEND